MSSGEVVVGKIVGVHGVRGYMKLVSYTSPLEQIWHYRPFFLHSPTSYSSTRESLACDLKLVYRLKRVFIVSMDIVRDREQASLMINSEIKVLRDSFPSTNDDEYYYCDLIDLRVVSSKREDLGRVTNVEDYGAGAIIVWENAHGQEEMHPYSDNFFGKVDLTEGEIEFLGKY